MLILLRIDRTPVSARTGNDADPVQAAAFQAYLRGLVTRLKGKVQAYELFNEPNLKWEWNSHIAGGQTTRSTPATPLMLSRSPRSSDLASSNSFDRICNRSDQTSGSELGRFGYRRVDLFRSHQGPRTVVFSNKHPIRIDRS